MSRWNGGMSNRAALEKGNNPGGVKGVAGEWPFRDLKHDLQLQSDIEKKRVGVGGRGLEKSEKHKGFFRRSGRVGRESGHGHQKRQSALVSEERGRSAGQTSSH